MATENPVVSVVIPSYNHAQFLSEALDSVLMQTFEDLEVVVVDDGSTDSTSTVLDSLAKTPRVRVLRQRNRGAHAAINRGIKQSRGRYLAILNSDDVFHQNRLERLLRKVRSLRNDSVLLFTDLDTIDANSSPTNEGRSLHYQHLSDLASGNNTDEAFLTGNLAYTTSNFFMARSFARKVGEFRNLRYCHDWDWILRARRMGRVLHLNETLLSYRIHSHNTVGETRIWQHISENAFVFGSFLNREITKNATIGEVSRLFGGALLQNDSFLPVPVLLVLVMLRARIPEAKILSALSKGDLAHTLEMTTTNNQLPLDLMLSASHLTERLHRTEGSTPGGDLLTTTRELARKFRKALVSRIR